MISSVETLTTDTQSDTKGTGIASESQHWYDKQGAPIYEVPCKSREGTRPTNIGDGRKMDLAPSYSEVEKCVAKPGLEAWKLTQVLEASLTLPRKQGEGVDAYAKRVIEDSKAQGIAAADRGTQLHKAIELYIGNQCYDSQWREHVIALEKYLEFNGIDIHAGQPEHSFAAQIDGNWYGGKLDFHTQKGERVILDFKSKDCIKPKQKLVYDNHAMQIGAYGYGLFGLITSNLAGWKWEHFRGINVFVGVSDCEIRVHEHTPEDLVHGFELFRSVLDFWTRKNKFGKYAKEKPQCYTR